MTGLRNNNSSISTSNNNKNENELAVINHPTATVTAVSSSSSSSVSSSVILLSKLTVTTSVSDGYGTVYHNYNNNNLDVATGNAVTEEEATATATASTTMLLSSLLSSDNHQGDDGDDDGDDEQQQQQQQEVRICFRNRTNENLLLCWVGDDGTFYHYYTLFPYSNGKNNKKNNKSKRSTGTSTSTSTGRGNGRNQSTTVGWFQKHVTHRWNHNTVESIITGGRDDDVDVQNENETMTITDNDHVETAMVGHVFVVVATTDMTTAQEQESLDHLANVRIIGAYRTHNNHIISSDLLPNDNHSNDENNSNDDSDEHSQQEEEIHLVEVIDPIETDGVSIGRSNESKPAGISSTNTGSTRCSLRQSIRNRIPCCQPKRKYKDENIHNDDHVDSVHDEEAPEAAIIVSNKYDRYVLTARLIRLSGDEVYDTTKKYYSKKYLGQCHWPIMMEPKWYGRDSTIPDVLACDLDFMASCLPPHAVTLLRDTSPTPIYVNKTLYYGPKHCPIQGRGMCFHPGSEWLQEQGMSPTKCESVELYKASEYRTMRTDWGMGGILIHEFSHAYHHKGCADGYDNQEIIDCYEAAMKDGIYDSVSVHGSQGPVAEAYAKTNAMEYFAELSTAFLGGIPNRNDTTNTNHHTNKKHVRSSRMRKATTTTTTTTFTTRYDHKNYNKWYPHNRQQIRDHDPRAYELLKKIWKITDDVE